MASLVRVLVLVAGAAAACGGGGDDGATDLQVSVEDTVGGLVDVEDVSCRREAEQLLASGIVRNRGDNPHHVALGIRFVDDDGVRVELANASVSDLETGESARWDATVYASEAGTVVACEVDAEAS